MGNPEWSESYFPAFSTMEACKKSFDEAGRYGYMIIKGTLREPLSALDCHLLLQKFGLVIDPDSDAPIFLPPGVRVQVKNPNGDTVRIFYMASSYQLERKDAGNTRGRMKDDIGI